MHRQPLLDTLQQYSPYNADEQQMLQDTVRFIQSNTDCFERSNLQGHITGSAWILNEARTHVLLIHHVKLDKWLQPGGHADGDTDILMVAMKEATEETGLAVTPLMETPFDVDVHWIPQRKDVPAHLHYDIRYLFTAAGHHSGFEANREVSDTRWIALEDVQHFNREASVLRMVEKSRNRH